MSDENGKDAVWIRERMSAGRKVLLDIGERLEQVRTRNSWSLRELAEWADNENLFESHARAVQLLQSGSIARTLEEAGLVTAVTMPAEWALRPLASAQKQGMPEPELLKTFQHALTAAGTDPHGRPHRSLCEAMSSAVCQSNWQKKRDKQYRDKQRQQQPEQTEPDTDEAIAFYDRVVATTRATQQIWQQITDWEEEDDAAFSDATTSEIQLLISLLERTLNELTQLLGMKESAERSHAA